ncbi:MAG TPA: holdfast attachment protein HfaA [Hyphomonadaceae bacterium]|jgi:hypothetical protein|nr:holdfast attachment protein HfaA [Hyphomonadaceae bacterium]
MDHGARQTVSVIALAVVASVGVTPCAIAQSVGNPAIIAPGSDRVPFGGALGDRRLPFDPATRDAFGNRTIIDGALLPGGFDLSSPGLGLTLNGIPFGGSGFSGAASAQAVGNQLNVITQGSNNTVIVQNSQTNTGNQTIILNGELDLDD